MSDPNNETPVIKREIKLVLIGKDEYIAGINEIMENLKLLKAELIEVEVLLDKVRGRT